MLRSVLAGWRRQRPSLATKCESAVKVWYSGRHISILNGTWHKVSYSAHKNAYSKGVLTGNWAEERQPSATRAVSFEGESVSHATYGKQGKGWPEFERKDWDRSHSCCGHDTILRHDEPHQDATLTPCYASLNQLAFGGASSAHPQVQKLLYTGRKENELRMPVTEGRSDLVHAKRQAWERESAANPWSISAREAANVAAVGGHGASCKRQGFRPASEGGQPAQVGRKARGEFAQLFDMSWIQIGLRK
ncbi:g3956 [Coccomyxa elongata]